MAYRKLFPQPEAAASVDEFLSELYRHLTDGQHDPNDVVRDALYQIYCGARMEPSDSDQLPPGARSLIHSFDPRNIATEPEYYEEIDSELYSKRKPFIWLWQMFDRSPLGQNALLGHRLRQMLAPLIFKQVGKNFKCWSFVEWSFGYNLSFGDNVVVHRHVLLDDRGGIEVGDDVSISDYVNVYSHSHDVDDIHKVYNQRTRIGNGARLTYHSTVLAGVQIGEHAMVGSGAVVTKDVEPYHIVLGIPARSAKVKVSQHVETAGKPE